MKKNKTTLIMVLFFFIGLAILLYPSISNFYNQKVQSKAIIDYESILNNIKKEDYTDYFNKADEYNKKLLSMKRPLLTYKNIKNYNKILNLNDHGMMGYLTIDKIKVELPIYHGTSADVLNKAVGHLEGTSLPVGGKWTHSVLSAHRGLPSFKLFTDLDKLEIGDTFVINILDRTITYQVDKITIVKPNQVNDLKIDKDGDYVTLLTCTPYGINTHRLLVRGKRIENEAKKTFITTEGFRISTLVVMPLVALPIIFSLLLIILIKPINKKVDYTKYIYPKGRQNDVWKN